MQDWQIYVTWALMVLIMLELWSLGGSLIDLRNRAEDLQSGPVLSLSSISDILEKIEESARNSKYAIENIADEIVPPVTDDPRVF